MVAIRLQNSKWQDDADFPVITPRASQTCPAARAAAPPPVDPAGVKEVFHGLRVLPNTSLKVDPPAPNSGVFDFAIIIPPIFSILVTRGCEVFGT